MMDLHYSDPRLAAIYDLESGWSEDRDFYLALAGEKPLSVLDLACGTGLLTAALAAAGHRVVGVDPAAAMLDVARARPFGDLVEWVESPAQDFRHPDRFDLIVMTGNAFQVFQDETDVTRVFQTMAIHLGPSGKAVFETRNPAIDWAPLWNTDQQVGLPLNPVTIRRRVKQRLGATIDFSQEFDLGTETLISHSRLRFWELSEIETLAHAAGLRVVQVLGDWAGQSFDPAQSHEMVVELRRA